MDNGKKRAGGAAFISAPISHTTVHTVPYTEADLDPAILRSANPIPFCQLDADIQAAHHGKPATGVIAKIAGTVAIIARSEPPGGNGFHLDALAGG